jgi:hypothetical protein
MYISVAVRSLGAPLLALLLVSACGDPIFTAAVLDLAVSTTDVADVHLSTHFDQREVDFAGVDYDQESFLKVDLRWEAIRCLEDI